MVRRLFVGMMVVIALTAISVPAAAQSRREGDVMFTVSVMPGESTLRADGKGITFLKRVTADRVHVRIDVPGDSFELEAGTTGTARLIRNGKSTTLHMTAAREEVAKAQRFAAGSKALASFESLAQALESSTRPEAQSVLTSFALLHAVRGSTAPARALARTVQARQAAGVTRASRKAAEDPYGCWMDYAVTLAQYMGEYTECYLNLGWIPGMIAVCTFEWMIKAELAWFWVIGCSGGIPV